MLPDRGIGRARTWPVLMTSAQYPGGHTWLNAVELPRGATRADAFAAAESYAAETWPDGRTVARTVGLAPLTRGELERVRVLLGSHGESSISHAAAGVEVIDPRPSGLHGIYVRPVHVPRDLFDIGPDLAARAGFALDRYRNDGGGRVDRYNSHADAESRAIRCAAADVPEAFKLAGWRAWLGREGTSPVFATRAEADACMRVYGHTVRALRVHGVIVATYHSGSRYDDGPGCHAHGTYAGPPLLRVLGERVDTMAERRAWLDERNRLRDAGDHAALRRMMLRDMPLSDTDYVRAYERPQLGRLRAAVLDIAAMVRPDAEVRHVSPDVLAEVTRDPRAQQLAARCEVTA